MSPVSRSTTGGRVYLDLQRLARSTGRPTDEVLRTYVLERFLWRAAQSVYREQLILKGGMLLAVFAARRPTADVDLLARDVSNDPDGIAAVVAAILKIDSDDGVSYAVDEISVTTIREGDAYPGVRVTVPAAVDRARVVLRVDVSVGDPVTPAPVAVEYPGLLHQPFTVVGYPFETVLAEKIVTMPSGQG
jgi:Nucleotidyl transferase AbiEii toxin, Type IV TA system